MSRPPRFFACLSIAAVLSIAAFVRGEDDKSTTAPAAADATSQPAAPAAPDAASQPAAPPSTEAAAPAATAPAAAADNAAAATQPQAEIPQNQNLHDDVEDFWHYGKIARYDLGAAMGKKILSRSEPPLEVLQNFEQVASDRQSSLDQWLLRWQALEGAKGSPADQMHEVAGQIIQLLDKGRFARRNDRKYIEEQIERLAGNQRVFLNAIDRLRESGEVAVGLMVEDLCDPKKAPLHDPIRQAMIALGRQSLNPLLAATDMRNNDSALITIVSALSQIGYDATVPYLQRLRDDSSASNSVRAAADNALRAIGADTRGKTTADLFYALSDRFYYGNAPITVDPKAEAAYLWSWDGQSLASKTVPPSIFNDLMAMREARYALQLGSSRGDALSLWLAANNKREVDLGEGMTDPTATPLSANFFNVYAGPQYLAAVLARSLQDHNAAVAMKVTKSLAQITGPSSLIGGGNPLVDATRYPDRLVRFEAAFALASALPTKPFDGSEIVVPLLAEAVSQTGVPNILIVVPSDAVRTKLASDLKAYGTAGGTSANAAIAESRSLPSVDVILTSEDLGASEIDRLFQLADQSPRLARAARVVITHTKASRWAELAIADPLLSTTQVTEPVGLAQAIEEARKRVGGLPLDEKVATAYALRAADLLEKLAINRNSVYDLSAAEPTLLISLNDKRPEVAKAVGAVLGTLDSRAAQPGILERALDDKTPEDVRISLFHSLAQSAKSFGNRLDESQVGSLQQVVDGRDTPAVRTAAAEARGALNLPADQAKQLIIEQKI